MQNKKLTVTGTGDSLFVAQFPAEYDTGIREVAEYIKSCDIKITNLETNLSDFDSFASAYSGGTWINTRRAYLQELLRYGFNYFGTANNHVMDYSYAGLLSTIQTLEDNKLAHSGTGASLEEAGKPAIVEANGVKSAIFAVDMSFNDVSRAGRATKHIKARPGVNFLRHETTYKINQQEEDFLRELAKKTKINFTRDLEIQTGFLPLDKPGFFTFGGKIFTTRDDVPETKCNQKDLTRILNAIKDAKQTCDYVFVLVHCHDNDGTAITNPPDYLKEFVHAAIDAGAAAIFGGGCHQLRGIEFYKEAPIFYSLGDFIYQGLWVELLPADFMEKFDVDIYATAEEALFARSRGGKVGLHCSKKNYQTVLPKLQFEGGKLTGFELLPLHLNFERKDTMNGAPVVAKDNEAAEIFACLSELSAPFGTKLAMKDGRFILA